MGPTHCLGYVLPAVCFEADGLAVRLGPSHSVALYNSREKDSQNWYKHFDEPRPWNFGLNTVTRFGGLST